MGPQSSQDGSLIGDSGGSIGPRVSRVHPEVRCNGALPSGAVTTAMLAYVTCL